MEIKIEAEPKDIKHSTKVKILGIEIEENLDGPMAIAKQLKTHINMLKMLTKTANEKQLRMLASGIFMSKLEYGAEVWASAPDYIIKCLQSIQLEAVRTLLGRQTKRWSKSTRLTRMKWLSVSQLAKLTSAKLSHKILTSSQPAVLSYRILSKINHTRATRHNGPFLLGPPPAGIGLTKVTKYQFRPNAYHHYQDIPMILKQIKGQKTFKKRLKRYIFNNGDLPTNRHSTRREEPGNHSQQTPQTP